MFQSNTLAATSLTFPRIYFVLTSASLAREGVSLIALFIIRSLTNLSDLPFGKLAEGIKHLCVAPIPLFGVLAPEWMSQWIATAIPAL